MRQENVLCQEGWRSLAGNLAKPAFKALPITRKKWHRNMATPESHPGKAQFTRRPGSTWLGHLWGTDLTAHPQAWHDRETNHDPPPFAGGSVFACGDGSYSWGG